MASPLIQIRYLPPTSEQWVAPALFFKECVVHGINIRLALPEYSRHYLLYLCERIFAQLFHEAKNSKDRPIIAACFASNYVKSSALRHLPPCLRRTCMCIQKILHSCLLSWSLSLEGYACNPSRCSCNYEPSIRPAWESFRLLVLDSWLGTPLLINASKLMAQ